MCLCHRILLKVVMARIRLLQIFFFFFFNLESLKFFKKKVHTICVNLILMSAVELLSLQKRSL